MFIKKIVIVVLCVLVFMVSIPMPKSHAFGVIGSNALKSAVIGSMEKAGITFANKEAKEKAFDAWNMRAYEKWKEDEAAGRNADLWEAFERWTLNPPVVESDPKKPGYGRMLLDSTIFGMAIGIGADIGFAIQDAQANETRMKYMSISPPGQLSGIDYIDMLPTVYKDYGTNGSWYQVILRKRGIDGWHLDIASSFIPGDADITITEVEQTTPTKVTFKYLIKSRNSKGIVSYTEKTATDNGTLSTEYKYSLIPEGFHVPNINPVPELAPLIVPNPAIETIPEVLPPDVPIEITVPLNPDIDPFDDGVINDPYIPPNPIPGTDPNEEPKDPEIDPKPKPEIDPGKKPEIDPLPEPKPDPTPDELSDPNKNPDKDPLSGGFWQTLWDWLKKILEAILNLPAKIIKLLKDLLLLLFIPSDGFFDGMLESMKMVIDDEFDNDDLLNKLKGLENGDGGVFKDIVVSLMGVDNLVVIDADSVNKVLDNIHSWVRGVVYPFLIFYNINQIYKLIRGTDIVSVTRGMRNRSGGAGD